MKGHTHITVFLKKSSLFLCVFCIGIIITSVVLNTYLGNKLHLKLDKNIKSVVFGHSHPECAFNDSLISNFKNLAQSGESYFYTYIKAKKVLNENPQIENVFIEFTNIDVTRFRDQEIWNDKYINWRYPTYAALMNEDDRFFLLSKNPISLVETLSKTFKKQFSRIQDKHYDIGSATSGYLHMNQSKLDSLLKAKTNTTNTEVTFYKSSVYNISYLEKTVALCREKNVNIYFVRSPIYKESSYLSNEILFNSVKNRKFNGIEFLDFVDFPLSTNEYLDLHHVNYKGAEKFSKYFNDVLIEKNIVDNSHSK